jgi:hypothetical protein
MLEDRDFCLCYFDRDVGAVLEDLNVLLGDVYLGVGHLDQHLLD